MNGNNRFQPSPAFETSVREGRILFDLGPPPLMPGRYCFSFWLGDMESDHHIELEAMWFELDQQDLWAIGRLSPPVTLLWWPTSFTFLPLSRSPVLGDSQALADDLR